MSQYLDRLTRWLYNYHWLRLSTSLIYWPLLLIYTQIYHLSFVPHIERTRLVCFLCLHAMITAEDLASSPESCPLMFTVFYCTCKECRLANLWLMVIWIRKFQRNIDTLMNDRVTWRPNFLHEDGYLISRIIMQLCYKPSSTKLWSERCVCCAGKEFKIK